MDLKSNEKGPKRGRKGHTQGPGKEAVEMEAGVGMSRDARSQQKLEEAGQDPDIRR